MGRQPKYFGDKAEYDRQKQAAYRARLKQERPEKYREILDHKKAYSAQWRKDNPEKHQAFNDKHRYYAYGLTDVTIAKLFAEQDGKCPICENELPFEKSRKWVIDHNHDTGKVRGILCHACNRALGQFKDSPAMLMKAIAYVER